jgi:hypothetical protein
MTKQQNEQLSAFLYSLMDKYGLTIRALSLASGVSSFVICEILRGERYKTRKTQQVNRTRTLARVLAPFNLRPDDLDFLVATDNESADSVSTD